MPTYEGLRLKALKYNRKLFGNVHKKDLKTEDFTIISNNCWGGEVYEYYNLQKQSPTVGLFIMADDYIRFVANLRDYIDAEIKFIRPEHSKWKEYWSGKDSRFGTYPIGQLELNRGCETVEIFFLHYHSEEEARSKWQRRCGRINWDKLLIKFNDQNGCTEEHIRKFIDLDYSHKAFFTCRSWPGLKVKSTSGLWYEEISQFPRHDQIMASFEPFNQKVTRIINSL